MERDHENPATWPRFKVGDRVRLTEEYLARTRHTDFVQTSFPTHKGIVVKEGLGNGHPDGPRDYNANPLIEWGPQRVANTIHPVWLEFDEAPTCYIPIFPLKRKLQLGEPNCP